MCASIPKKEIIDTISVAEINTTMTMMTDMFPDMFVPQWKKLHGFKETEGEEQSIVSVQTSV